MINKKNNISITACYYTDTNIANKNNYFALLVIMFTLYKLQLN